MKRKYLRVVCVFATLLLAFAALASCNNSGDDQSDDTPKKITYNIINDGKEEFSMIYPDNAEPELSARVSALWKHIKAKYGVTVKSESDWSVDNETNETVTSDSSVHEILIGDTNREESRLVAKEYKDLHGFVVKVVNGKIVIWGNALSQTLEAIQYFEDIFLQSDVPAIDEDFCFVHDMNEHGSISNILANEFSVTYSQERSSRELMSARSLAKYLQGITGTKPVTHSDAGEIIGKEILIGATNREQSIEIDKTLNYMDYYVKVSSDCVVLIGGSPLATESAVNHFKNAIETGEITSLYQGYEYSFDFDPYIKDSLMYNVDSFVPVWANNFTVPEWLTDFDEKLYAMTCPTGRLMGDAHRGDTQHYPENSLPAILSAIMLGADSVEIDIRLTKDNIMVLLHDEHLKRATNWNEMRGKNGLPTSEKVSDWTYEQLLQLNLMHNGNVTEYKIATVYEAVSLFDGRTQIHFDCKDESIDKNSDVYLLAEELGVKECFIYYYGIDTMKEWVSYNPEDTEFEKIVNRVSGYLELPNHALRNRKFELIAMYGDHAEGWHKQYSLGYKMVFTDKIYDFCRYVAKNQSPIA